jgi:septal ring factor EnvC (AmiA/AmiB activator)
LQIETLRREMAAAEGSRRDAVDQLKDAERAISTTQRDLLQLTTQVDSLQATLRDLGTQARALEQQLSAQQAQLGKLLYRQYLRGTPDPLRLFLNGDDPNQLARDLHYLGLIGRARSQILQEIEATLHRKQALATDNERATAAADARGNQQSIWHNKAGGKHLEGPFYRRQSRQRGTQHRQWSGSLCRMDARFRQSADC